MTSREASRKVMLSRTTVFRNTFLFPFSSLINEIVLEHRIDVFDQLYIIDQFILLLTYYQYFYSFFLIYSP